MSIVSVDVYPLTGGTVDGGWPQGHEPQENLHTILIVRLEMDWKGMEAVSLRSVSGRGD